MIRFGMAGNSIAFAQSGRTSSLESPAWAASFGLNAFEYSFGRGVQIHTKMAEEIGQAAVQNGVEISVHAPYYINMSSEEQEKRDNSINYVLQSLRALRAFGGKRCVFHVGSQAKLQRDVAFATAIDVARELADRIRENGYDDLIVCPETMGKVPQIGSNPEEILEICKISENFYPCYDFGHINAVTQGSLKTSDDFSRYIDRIFEVLGDEKAKNMHIHFSKIQYGDKGEIRHLTFADDFYGPEFENLARVIYDYGMTPVIISESAGTQDQDAATMLKIYNDMFK